MSDKPVWRQAVESLDKRVSGSVERIVRDEGFAIAVGLLLRARREVSGAASRVTTAMLHAVNLPAKQDFDRVMRQLASLEREVLILADSRAQAPVATARDAKPAARRAGGSREVRPT
jgi:hypothetical protein